jgi:hypothetical protein
LTHILLAAVAVLVRRVITPNIVAYLLATAVLELFGLMGFTTLAVVVEVSLAVVGIYKQE